MSDPLEPYWAALGKFLHRYALAEATLNQVLRICANVTDDHAKALFSGTRVTSAISFIRRIHEADGKKLSPWLDRAFPKLSELTSARDEILHQGFALEGDKIIVSNRDRTLPRQAFERPYGINDLLNLERDSCVAHACLNMFWLEAEYPKEPKAMVERERQIALTPWLHTPPQPAPKKRKTQKAARKP